MKTKKLNRVKKVLLSVFATAILALIAVNVNLAQKNGELKSDVKLGSTETLAQSEYGGSGGCSMDVSVLDWGWLVVFYDCVEGNGNYCSEGMEQWDGWGCCYYDVVPVWCK